MQQVVDHKFIDNVRRLLICLAQTDNRPPSERMKVIEKHRQYCEGYLDIKREAIAAIPPAELDAALLATGFILK